MTYPLQLPFQCEREGKCVHYSLPPHVEIHFNCLQRSLFSERKKHQADPRC